jgi:hypothetical protein
MKLMTLLELLASNAHHQVNIENLLHDLPDHIRQAFLSNNAELLKKQFNDSTPITANRSSIVQVKS